MSVRVALVDDEPLVRAGLAAIIDSDPGLDVVGEAGDGAEALDLVRRTRPDVVVMDVRMPRLDGLEATRHLVDLQEPPRILILTTFDSDDYVFEALRAGADGFVLKRAQPEELVRAVHTVAGGEALLYPQKVREMASRAQRRPDRVGAAGLSRREEEVLTRMARGLSNSEIAAEMFLGVETVKTYVSSVLAKLGARDRTQAVIVAFESGFVGR
ncbi:LuxR family two component transcriptional regulator [Brevibacterium sanguinis]|uniref:LuxR family two component transcriptional regulator n=2 Tax=Brevibacterium TaxID=1696 RepID=A0A366IM60_9MICO|nr:MULTISPECIES: response regulator transcription factor [Brevibacterium]RBP65649.1 LuxR family two component transcriptional regulator [Brevibacterium sanguinis]RBP72283.1 LuxR family two component transcriptional regulator [Brevibacterium celere]